MCDSSVCVVGWVGFGFLHSSVCVIVVCVWLVGVGFLHSTINCMASELYYKLSTAAVYNSSC